MTDTKEMKLEYPCVFKFYFDGCMPCKKITPKVEELIDTCNFGRVNKIQLYPIDTLNQKNESLIDRYDVRKVPSFAVLHSQTESTKLLSFVEFEKHMIEKYSQ